MENRRIRKPGNCQVTQNFVSELLVKRRNPAKREVNTVGKIRLKTVSKTTKSEFSWNLSSRSDFVENLKENRRIRNPWSGLIDVRFRPESIRNIDESQKSGRS